jgi:3-deoxy-manno-octulosonate cytidylyltransferase (CMP-KDO synthetase)
MRVVGIIAARMASTRFPGKPLVQVRGIPMIGHVYHRAHLARQMHDVWIATCDQSIMDYAAGIGANAVLTRDTHERATDRIAEAVPYIEERTGQRVDVAVLVQGDEPMLQPEMLDELISGMMERRASVANLMNPIADASEFEDANTVKVVCDRAGYALYLSREPIPSRRKFADPVPMWKQLGLIAFTRDALLEYSALPSTPLEQIESVDMNRLVEHGRKLLMVPSMHRITAIDTPEDRVRVEGLMADDRLMSTYQGSGIR